MKKLTLLLASLVLSGSALAQEPPPITKLPKPRREVQAFYPDDALRDRVAATVVMQLDIDADGNVESLTVVSTTTTAESSTTALSAAAYGFVRSATTAVGSMEFEPAEAGGVPVPVRIAYTYRFALPPPPPPPPPSIATATSAEPADSRVVNFTGVLRERGTRRRLSGVVVTVFREEQGFEAVTDGEGIFKFYALAPGEWRVLAETDGYYPFRTSETMSESELVDVTYYLEKGSYNPYDVIVEAKRPVKEVNRRTLTTAEIVKVAGTLGDPILVIENLPGVARPPPASGLIVVRGSGPENTGVYIDSVEIPLIYHFGGLRSVVPSDVIESIDFYPGNFPVFYGRVTGGIFDAHIKRLKPDQVHGSLDVSLLDAGLYLETPIAGGLSVAIAGRRSYIDGILNAVVPDDSDVNLVAAPRYYDYQILADWRITDEHSIRGVFLGSDDQVKLLFENPSELDAQLSGGDISARTNFNRFYTIYEFTPSKELSNELRFAVGRDNVDTSFFSEFFFLIDILTFQARDSVRWQLLDNLTLTFGADAVYRIVDISIRLPRAPKEGDPATDIDFDDVLETTIDGIQDPEAGLYLDAEWKVIDQLLLVPGVRVDYFHRVEQFAVDPRLVARWEMFDHWTLKGGVGLVHQQPTGDETDETFGNPDLSLESAVQYSIGGEWKPLDYLSFDLTLFYNDLHNQVSRSGNQTTYDNGGQGKTFGMELFIRHDFHDNFRGWLSYTLSRSERTESGETEARLFTYDQTHILNVNLSYVFPANWEVGLRWRLVSGNPNTPFVGSVFLSDSDEFVPISGAINSGRLPLFHQLDLRVEKRWVFDWYSISAYISIINTYNQANVEALNYDFDFSHQETVSGLPILPILGIRGEL